MRDLWLVGALALTIVSPVLFFVTLDARWLLGLAGAAGCALAWIGGDR